MRQPVLGTVALPVGVPPRQGTDLVTRPVDGVPVGMTQHPGRQQANVAAVGPEDRQLAPVPAAKIGGSDDVDGQGTMNLDHRHISGDGGRVDLTPSPARVLGDAPSQETHATIEIGVDPCVRLQASRLEYVGYAHGAIVGSKCCAEPEHRHSIASFSALSPSTAVSVHHGSVSST